MARERTSEEITGFVDQYVQALMGIFPNKGKSLARAGETLEDLLVKFLGDVAPIDRERTRQHRLPIVTRDRVEYGDISIRGGNIYFWDCASLRGEELLKRRYLVNSSKGALLLYLLARLDQPVSTSFIAHLTGWKSVETEMGSLRDFVRQSEVYRVVRVRYEDPRADIHYKITLKEQGEAREPEQLSFDYSVDAYARATG